MGKIKGFYVTLSNDLSEEGGKNIRKAILMLKEVIGVKAIKSNPGDYLVGLRIKDELKSKLYKLINEL